MSWCCNVDLHKYDRNQRKAKRARCSSFCFFHDATQELDRIPERMRPPVRHADTGDYTDVTL